MPCSRVAAAPKPMPALRPYTELRFSSALGRLCFAHGWLWLAQPTTVRRSSRSPGLTLVELLLTVAVIAILAAVLIPQISSDIPERLDAAAQVVTSDLDYARSLAVANDSIYRVRFEPAQNRYFLTHFNDANPVLNVLPRSPFRQNNDAPDQQTTNLSELPIPKPTVRLAAIVRMQGAGVAVTEVVFDSLGKTTEPQDTVIWLACGAGSQRRYVSVHINHATGLTETGALLAALPTAINTIAAQNLAAAEAANEVQ